MKGSLKVGPTMLPLFKKYMTIRGKPCQNPIIMFSEHDRHTLVVGDEHRQDGEGDGPQTRIADSVDDILDLGMIRQFAVPDAGERRDEAGAIGLHDMRELQPRDRLSLQRAPSQAVERRLRD